MAPKSARIAEVPCSVESEQALLGSVLFDRTVLPRIVDVVRVKDFTRPDHREIFSAISELARKQQPIDTVTVFQHLQAQGRADVAGGLDYLGTLVRETPGAGNVEAYARALREMSTLREFLTLSDRITRSVYDWRGCEAEDLIADIERTLLELRPRSRTGKGLIASRQLGGELLDDLDRRQANVRGLPLGLADFDELTSGLEPGDLVVIAARPGMGKTALMISVAATVSQSITVAIFSAEMPAPQLMRRCVALLSNVPQGKLRRAERLTDSDWTAIAPAAAAVADRQLWIDDKALPTLTYVRAESMSLKTRSTLGLVMVDYCQLVQGHGANRYEQLRDVAYGFKALAKDLQVPVILLAQLNRGVESRDDKRPHISDLRDSGAIEEAADIVGLLYSRGYYDKDFGMPYVLECAIEKNRNGERGQYLWQFEGAFSRITLLESGAAAQYRNLRARQAQRGGSDL
jgi:replicative DNA helicase